MELGPASSMWSRTWSWSIRGGGAHFIKHVGPSSRSPLLSLDSVALSTLLFEFTWFLWERAHCLAPPVASVAQSLTQHSTQ